MVTAQAAEVRLLLDELDARLGRGVAQMWAAAAGRDLSSPEFRQLVIDAYPDLVLPFSATAADVGAVFYDEQPTTTRHVATTAELVPEERLRSSATWALDVGTPESAVALLQGSATRAMFDGFRDTILDNVIEESAGGGAKWARHASATACGFCRLVATRGAVYDSEASAGRVVGRAPEITLSDRRAIHSGLMTREQAKALRQRYVSASAAAKAGKQVGDLKPRRTRGNQRLGDRYHDNCKCLAVPVRPGSTWSPPAYYAKWEKDYYAAVDLAREQGLTRGKYGAIDPKVVSRLMNSM